MHRKKIRKGSSSKSTPNEIVNNDVFNHRQIENSIRDSTFDLNENKSNKLLYGSELNTQDDTNIISKCSQKNKNLLNKKNINLNNLNNNTKLTPRDLEIMKIFTSRRWSKKSFSKSIINMQIDKKEIQTMEEIENNTTNKVERENSLEFTDQEKYSISEYENTSTSTNMNPRESYDSLQIKDEHDLENNLESLNENIRVLRDEQELEYNQDNLNENVGKSEEFSEVLRDEQDLENNLESLNENTRKSRDSFEVYSSTETNKSFENMSFEVSLKSMETVKKSDSIISNKDMIFEYLLSDTEKIFETSKNINNSNEYINQISIGEETYSYELDRDYSKEQVSSPKYSSTVQLTPPESKDEIWTNKAFMQHFYIDDTSDSELVDLSSIWSFNTTMMAQVIQHQVKLANNYTTMEKPINNKSALNTAVKLILEKTRDLLGDYLIEGIYLVAKKYREDPFKYLGQWLLIQADIRDENEKTK